MHQFSVDTAVACAVRTFAFPPASFRAHGARYYRVYPKTVRRTVVLCRGGPRGRPPPGNLKGCPYGCTSAFGLRMVAGMSFSVASPYAQIYRRHGSSTVSISQLCVGPLFCVGAALCGRPPPGNHIGLPLRLLQRFLATSGCRSEFFCCLPLCTNLA